MYMFMVSFVLSCVTLYVRLLAVTQAKDRDVLNQTTTNQAPYFVFRLEAEAAS